VKATTTRPHQHRFHLGLPDYVIHNTNGEPYDTNTMYQSHYSPLPLLTDTVDGQAVGIEVQREFGGSVCSRMVTVPSGATVTVRREFEGGLPVADDDELRVMIAASDPRRPMIAGSGLDGAEVTDGRFVSTVPISENRTLFVRFASG